jgi:NAD+ synthase (glutamine-hydrolysing)
MINFDKLRIGLHQLNTVTGDIKGNTDKIIEQIKLDSQSNCDLSIFPETAITGYMCGSLWDRPDL